MLRDVAKALRELQRAFGDLRQAYRPERHYMRGPGPKWHAKRAGSVGVAALDLRASIDAAAMARS